MKQVMRCLEDSPAAGVSLGGIIESLYPGSGRMKREFVRGWIMLVLDKFIREGIAGVKGGRFYPA